MRKFYLFLVASVFPLVALVAPCLSQPTLKVGALIPFTGRSGDAGRECLRGMLDAARSINQRGGVQGRRLEILLVDDTFQPAEQVAAFRKLNEVDNIPLLQIYSGDSAQTLLPYIQLSRIPTVVGSLPSPLANPSRTPYLFSIIPTPLDLAKMAITFISEKSGIRNRKPKMVFIGSSDYIDQHFLEEAKIYAKSMGLEVEPDVAFTDLSLVKESDSSDRTLKQVSSLLAGISKSNPDFAYLSLNSREASAFIQEAKKTGLKTRWICNSSTFDEALTPYEGVMGVQPISFFGEDIPGMTEIKEAHQKWHPNDTHTLYYVEGWATVLVMAEALGRALPEKQFSRERVKASLESFRNYVMGGLVPPLTITPEDHRPSTESRILVIRNGKISVQSSFISLPREKKPPR
jgi:branched-chain amino acid transport system substrate-binding protein